jgi:hypothetical protein
VASAAAQTHPPHQIVIVDDGSDAPVAAPDLPGIAVTLRRLSPGRGRGPARNAAVAAATGDALTWLDDDDWLEPGFLAALAAGGDGGHLLRLADLTVEEVATGQRHVLRRAGFDAAAFASFGSAVIAARAAGRPPPAVSAQIVGAVAPLALWRALPFAADPAQPFARTYEDAEWMMRYLARHGRTAAVGSAAPGYVYCRYPAGARAIPAREVADRLAALDAAMVANAAFFAAHCPDPASERACRRYLLAGDVLRRESTNGALWSERGRLALAAGGALWEHFVEDIYREVRAIADNRALRQIAALEARIAALEARLDRRG